MFEVYDYTEFKLESSADCNKSIRGSEESKETHFQNVQFLTKNPEDLAMLSSKLCIPFSLSSQLAIEHAINDINKLPGCQGFKKYKLGVEPGPLKVCQNMRLTINFSIVD